MESYSQKTTISKTSKSLVKLTVNGKLLKKGSLNLKTGQHKLFKVKMKVKKIGRKKECQ